MAKRVRSILNSVENKQYETHQLDGQGHQQVSEISDGLQQSETFEYLATEQAVLNQLALIFHDRD